MIMVPFQSQGKFTAYIYSESLCIEFLKSAAVSRFRKCAVLPHYLLACTGSRAVSVSIYAKEAEDKPNT